MIALHVGIRDAEIRSLTWGSVDLLKAMLTWPEEIKKEPPAER